MRGLKFMAALFIVSLFVSGVSMAFLYALNIVIAAIRAIFG